MERDVEIVEAKENIRRPFPQHEQLALSSSHRSISFKPARFSVAIGRGLGRDGVDDDVGARAVAG